MPLLAFEGRLDIEINGEAAIITGERSELQLEARRPLHFLAAAGIRPSSVGMTRRLSRTLANTGLCVSVVYRGRRIASIGAGVTQDLAARVLGIENARFGSSLAMLFRK